MTDVCKQNCNDGISAQIHEILCDLWLRKERRPGPNLKYPTSSMPSSTFIRPSCHISNAEIQSYPCRGISFLIIIFSRRRSNATRISGVIIRADMDPALIIDDDRTLTGPINQNQIVFLVGLLHLSPLGNLLPFDARFFKAATRSFTLSGCCRRCNIPICVFTCFSGVDNALSWNI